MQPRATRPTNHHIWNNNGTYFLHVTLLWNGRKKLRLRKSLRTKDVAEARRLRDHVLDQMRESPEMTLLIR
jgi:hypothetical protein